MADESHLAVFYLENHPREAAEVLDAENAAPEDVAQLLAALPDAAAAKVLSALTVTAASACLAALSDANARRLLGYIPRREAAAIVRLLPSDRQSAVLRALPAASRVQIELMLRQSAHHVGAWMDTAFQAVPQASTVDALRRRLRRLERPVNELYLVDDAGRLAGVVHPTRLFQATGSAAAGTIAHMPAGKLRSGSSIQHALAEPAWRDADVLPVIDGREKLIGTIRHATLREAVWRDVDGDRGDAAGDYLALANNLYVALAEVLSTSIGKPPATGLRPPIGEQFVDRNGGPRP